MKNKKRLILVLLSILLLLITGCTPNKQLGYNGSLESEKIEITNSASAYCIEVGGTVKAMDDELGQYNLCILASGVKIEEWEHFNVNSEDGDLAYCKSWYDGCNTCFVTNGKIDGCTKKACSEEIKTKPKCMLFNDEKIIGKILKIKQDEIQVRKGDIAYIFDPNNLDVSLYIVGNIVEIIYNRDEHNNNLVSTINVYIDEEKEKLECTKEYVPVCAQTTTNTNGVPILKTFSNSCMVYDSKIIHQGNCGKDSLQAAEQRICTLEYAPVCALFNGVPKTFGNACGAKGLELISEGKCQ
jgi:putative hemolysin